ncbi:MAG: SPOR domain-containing protein [Pelistega sp.]|nr:SPOR domain-containing protein [Pelistega sp.]
MATRRKSSPRRNGSSPFGYVIFGIVAGLGIAAAAAYYLRANSQKTAPSTPVVTQQQKLTPPTPRPDPVVVQTPPAVQAPPAVAPAPAVEQTPAEPVNTTPAVVEAPQETPPSIAQQVGNQTPPAVAPTPAVEQTPAPAVAAQQPPKQQAPQAPKAEPKPTKEPKKESPKQVASKTAPKSDDQIGNLINTMNSPKKAEAKAEPKTESKQTVAKAATNTKTAPQYLQVGSFKSSSEADAKRAQLLMQGFSNITITKATVNNTEFNRVRIGPFSSDASLKEAQERLKSQNINATVIR